MALSLLELSWLSLTSKSQGCSIYVTPVVAGRVHRQITRPDCSRQIVSRAPVAGKTATLQGKRSTDVLKVVHHPAVRARHQLGIPSDASPRDR